MIKNINLICPKKDLYNEIRYFIEVVKQDKITEDAVLRFIRLCTSIGSKKIILGCTELPVLYEFCKHNKDMQRLKFYDPLEVVIKFLQKEYYDDNNLQKRKHTNQEMQEGIEQICIIEK